MSPFFGIQLISIMFAVFMLYISFIHFKKENINTGEFIFWIALWSGFVFVSLNPAILNPILQKLFITRALDLLMIAAFMILAYLGFMNHVGIKHLNKRISTIIKKDAINNAKEN